MKILLPTSSKSQDATKEYIVLKWSFKQSNRADSKYMDRHIFNHF